MNWLKNIFGKSKVQNKPVAPLNLPIVCEASEFEAEHFLGTSILCDAYHLKGNFTLNEVADFVRKKRVDHPDSILLASLDHPAQAAYTSTHATLSHDLDSLKGHDEASLPETAFEYVEDEPVYIGHFPIRHHNFMAEVKNSHLGEISHAFEWQSEEQLLDLIRTTETVSGLPREQECIVQIVPVQYSAESIVAFPNGYFDLDANPFENFDLAREMSNRFGFNLFGIGARYLGFMSDEPLDPNKAKSVAEFLFGATDGKRGKVSLLNMLAKKLTGQSEIYIAYAEKV